jgi:hypothetical protein
MIHPSRPKLFSPLLAVSCAFLLVLNSHAATTFEKSPRGVVVETDRFRAVIEDGALTGFFNKLTSEEYLSGAQALAPVSPHLPSGLGSQNGKDAFAAAAKIFGKGWSEFSPDLDLPNQHFPTAKSEVQWKAGEGGGVLTYKNLSDGKNSFPDETFAVKVAVDPETGDLLLTPSGKSPREGVYGANLSVAPTSIGVTVEAPVFDGMRITPDMAPTLWHNKWPEYWDYAFLALNGSRRGAVGIWAQDADFRYKDLFFLPTPDNGGIALSLGTMNVPPFDKSNEAEGVTWRVQAFDNSWTQAAERFRQWRKEHVKTAPRPDWTRRISFVNSGVSAQQPWLDILVAYFNGEHLDRTVTFAPVIRAAAFDTKHWDNTPYATFREEMPAWKKSGAKLMAYLQPMIVWGMAPEDDKEAQKVVAMHKDADTRSVFQDPPTVKQYVDQHHLGHAAWQRWFLDWVHAYIQDYGADGVYHDQSYPVPVDSRGLVNGMTAPQGMADYFYKAATESPDSIHGSEHMHEVNTVGASLGIASGILWGEAPNMRRQRILHPSPVTNALHYPNATLWAFPHYSDFGTRGDATLFHWGMDLSEGRAELAGLALQNAALYLGKQAPYAHWVNELKMDRTRSLLFVRNGLRPVFPADADRKTISYFRGANGEDFRYEKTPWGSRFVQFVEGGSKVHYGRAHGVTHAPGTGNGGGNVAGWLFYNKDGPSGFHPDRYYVLDPDVARPSVYFSPAFEVFPGAGIQKSFYEHFIEASARNDDFAFLKIRPIESVGNIIKSDKIFLHAKEAPKKVWVNGVETPVQPKTVDGETVYEIAFASPATIAVLLREPKEGISTVADLQRAALLRAASSVDTDVFDPAWYTTNLAVAPAELPGTKTTISGLKTPTPLFVGIKSQQIYLPLKAPASMGGTLKLHFKPVSTGGTAPKILPEWAVNGVSQPNGSNPLEVPFRAGESKILSVSSPVAFTLAPEWVEQKAAP